MGIFLEIGVALGLLSLRSGLVELNRVAMPEPTERLTDSQSKTKSENDAPPQQQKTVNPIDLVYTGGTTRDPRELVENPAVTPEMLNQPGDLRDDLLEED